MGERPTTAVRSARPGDPTGDTHILAAHPRLVGNGGGRNGADPFVIALAMVNHGAVVTDETFSGNLNKPRIPDVCQALSVPCMTVMDFVEAQHWSF